MKLSFYTLGGLLALGALTIILVSQIEPEIDPIPESPISAEEGEFIDSDGKKKNPEKPGMAIEPATNGDADWPPSPATQGAIRAERLSQTGYRQIFHRSAGGFPTRLERQLTWDPQSQEWKLTAENEMAANRILVRSTSGLPAPAKAHYNLKGRQTMTPAGWTCFEFDYLSSEDRLGRLLAEFEKLGYRAEPDYLVEATDLLSGDPLFQAGKQSYMDPIASFVEGSLAAATLWEAQADASAATVAILDSGLHLSHEEFSGQLWLNEQEIADNGIDDDNNGWVDDLHGYNFVDASNSLWDDHGHGTHVAGLIGASGDNGVGMAGTAWKSTLMPVKVLNAAGSGFVSDVIGGIEYAITNDADVMLLGWQTGADSVALRDALEAAQSAGLVWSVPAGNNSRALDEFPRYPAVYSFENQITVTSHNLDGSLSNFSNYGISHVAVSAPGNDLISTSNAGDSAYERRTGTSQASALVAGLLAHLRTAHPEEPGWRLIQRIRQSATERPRENFYLHGGNRDYVAAGRVNLASPALLAIDSTPANDRLGEARRFQRPSFSQSVVMLDATAEPGEPAHGGVAAESTVWYEWEPQAAGTASLRTDHPAASLAVYSGGGRIDQLQPVASALATEGGAALEFQAQARTTYYCVVNLPSGRSEPVRTDFRLLPDNRDFPNALVLNTNSFGRSRAALSTDGQGGPANEAWQRWIAPLDGILEIRAKAEMDARLTVYSVDEAGQLGEEIGSVDILGLGTRSKQRSFDIRADTEYAFRWKSLSGGSGYVEWSGTYRTAPTDVSIFTYGSYSPLWGTEYRIGSFRSGGTPPLSYKWYRDGELVRSGTWSYHTAKIDFPDAGVYHLVVSNDLGTVESTPIEISVRALPPKVRITPNAVKSSEGSSASFHANVSDSLGASVTLEWFLNGEKLQGSTLRNLSLENLTLADSGILKAKATNRFGTTWSQEVLLSITENPLTDWKRVMPNTAGYNSQSATSAGGRYFVIAPGATLHTSPDGINWVEAVFDESFDSISGIAYGNDTYMAVGKRGSTPIVLTSDDGIFWSPVHEASGGVYDFVGLTFGNGYFVTLRNIDSSGSTIYVSSDGLNWETSELNETAYRSPVFGNGIFLISRNGTHFVSEDGLDWTAHAVASGGPDRTGSLTYHDGYFYKLSGSGFTSIGLYRSANGITWEVVSPPGYKGPIKDTDGLYYNGQFYMVPNVAGIYYSATGSSFLRHTGNETGDSQQGWINDLALLGDTIIGIDDIGRIIHGETITDLTFSEPVFSHDIHRMESLKSVLVVMGSNGGSADVPRAIAWTSDGLAWEINESPRVKDIVEWNDRFYAIGAPNSNNAATGLIASSDLRQWHRPATLPDQGDLIEAGNGRLVVVLEDGRVTTSMDGVEWTTPQATNGRTEAVNEMRFLNGEFWLARSSSLHRSTDGVSWQEVALADIKDLTYASGKYIATPYQNGVLYESTDGFAWTGVSPGGNLTAKRLKTDGSSVYGALNRALLFSEDLSEWTSVELETSSTDVAYFNGSIFYSGASGLVYRHGTPVAAPSLSADILETLQAEPISVSSTIHFDYSAESGSGSVTVSLFANGELVDQSADGDSLAWTPNRGGRHQIQLKAEDENGLWNWTDLFEIHVKGSVLRQITDPAGLEASGLLSKNNAAWITTARGDLYYRSDPDAKWIHLDASEAADGFNGAYKDEDGHLYAFGWVVDAFGESRGIILRSNEGQVWERFGTLLPNPVIDVLRTQVDENEDALATFYALTLDPAATNSTAPSGLHFRSGNALWTQVPAVDTLREIVEWNSRIYAKDRAGDVLVSDNGFEWSLEFGTGAYDAREDRLEATEDILLLNGSSRVYHNRVNGGSWGYISPEDRTLIVDGTVYTESYQGLYELTAQGLLEPTSRFATLYMGGALGNPLQVEQGDGWNLWRTDTGRITASTSNDTGAALGRDDFPESSVLLIEGRPFRRVDGDGIAPLHAPEGWSSTNLADVAAESGIRDIAFGNTTTLFVGEDGLYRHNPSNDTWTRIRSTGDLHALAHSQGRLWLGGSETFEYSDDGGDTWITRYDDLHALSGFPLEITQIIADGDRVAVNAVSRDILLSLDGGSSWDNTGCKANRIAFTPTELIFAGDDYGDLARIEIGQELPQIERFPFGLPSNYFPGHSWDVHDFLWQDGTEYLLLANYASGALLERSPGEDWEMVEFPRAVPSSGVYLAATDTNVFWVSASAISQVVSHNFKTSLILGDIENLGVSDSFEAIFRIQNQGVGLSPETAFTVKGFLQPAAGTFASEALPIGSYRANIPQIMDGEFHDLTLRLRIPEFVSPGTYHLRLAAVRMRDTRSADNTASSENPVVNIPTRIVDIQVSGNGSVTILDERSEYPDKFSLPIQINPAPGYVYSFKDDGSGEVNATGLQTLILDQSFSGSVYFEPSFETWATEAIPASETRSRSGIAHGGLPNIFKYVFGYEPTDTGRASALTIFEDTENGERSLAYEVIRGREHEPLNLMISHDLETWDSVATEATPVGDHIRFDASIPAPFSDRAFFQFEAD